MLLQNKKTYALPSRRFLSITGEDAESFLQNVMTNDISKIGDSGILYTCLLSPQGQILNEFFVVKSESDEGYLIDIDQDQIDPLLRRLGFFKLRAKVTIAKKEDIFVTSDMNQGYADPRYPGLGYRFYTNEKLSTEGAEEEYKDLCMRLCIPYGFSTIEAERDVIADANLDLLHAVAFDKGCFIGQEVVARMYHRNLSRKRLMLIEGNDLKKGATLYQKAAVIGAIRDVDSAHGIGLAQIKLNFVSGQAAGLPVSLEPGGNIAGTLQNPLYAQF